MTHNPDYRILPFPRSRQVVLDAGWMGTRRHLSHALLEFDVTNLREWIRSEKVRTGESPSLTACFIWAFSRAIARDPTAQAYRNWRGQLVVFTDVDVATLIETTKGTVALPHIIRSANCKSFQQIQAEIRSVKGDPSQSPQKNKLLDLGIYAPIFLRRAFWRVVLKLPATLKRYSGTTVVTSVGMFGKGGGWGVTFLPVHTLGLTIGGVVQRPGVVDGNIAIREYIDLTITFDHDIVDGAPAVRFLQHFKEQIESFEAN
jgi:pyruvate/2-oxoglutarate dehydrogenase complex dihydrolipoamide acyltransferase (E2) component